MHFKSINYIISKVDNQKRENKKEEQIPMALPSARFERFYNFKRRVNASEKELRYVPINRTVSFWVIFFSTIFTLITLVYQISLRYSGLPNEVPLLFSQIDSSWVLLPKIFIYSYLIIPIVNLGLLAIPIRRMYSLEKRLTVTLMIFMNLSNLFVLVGIYQIISLTTI